MTNNDNFGGVVVVGKCTGGVSCSVLTDFSDEINNVA